jgi:hypothetical protein
VTDALAGLRALPQLRLAHLPTPLEPMPGLGAPRPVVTVGEA